MPFPYLHYEVPDWYRETFSAKRQMMFRKEVARRVRILRSLGYSKDEIKIRIRGHLEWDLDLHESSPILDDYDGVIEYVWERG